MLFFAVDNMDLQVFFRFGWPTFKGENYSKEILKWLNKNKHQSYSNMWNTTAQLVKVKLVLNNLYTDMWLIHNNTS